MRIQTFSIVAGSEACNARCPFCISKMTPPQGVALKEPVVNWRNFRKASFFAKQSGATTVLITSKGEPTLFPEQITKYLDALKEFDFPFIELQTNGILIAEQKERYLPFIKTWYDRGMTLIAISIVHYESEKNRQIYLPYKKEYIDLAVLIKNLHDIGFSVRLACVLADGFIDTPKKLNQLVLFAKQNNVEHLTIRPVNKPQKSRDNSVGVWVEKNYLKETNFEAIKAFLATRGVRILDRAHNVAVYDVDGQNVCLTNCLVNDPTEEELRQFIFFPDGHLRYDWQYAGAIVL